jgi:hypothetical protein
MRCEIAKKKEEKVEVSGLSLEVHEDLAWRTPIFRRY